MLVTCWEMVGSKMGSLMRMVHDLRWKVMRLRMLWDWQVQSSA